MNRQVTILAIILFTILGFMGYNSYKTQEMVAENRSMLMDGFQHVAEVQMMMDSFVQLAPDEMESIARRISKEEGLKLFKQFAENLNKTQEIKEE
jgi:hypothetical protein|tara:strand:- start:227 stop:511 length:285 start_codon:yes stop_codon:yes gene_type:complete